MRSACTKSTADRKRDWRKVFGQRVGNLGLQLNFFVRKRQFFKSGGTLCKENQVERVVGPIGKRNLDQFHAEFL